MSKSVHGPMHYSLEIITKTKNVESYEMYNIISKMDEIHLQHFVF